MATPLFGPKFRWFTNIADGALSPLALGKVYLYEAGTSTPKDSYTTSVGDVANTNPVNLDAEGYPETGNIYLGTGKYKVVVKDAAGNTMFTEDDYEGTILLIDTITASSSTSVSIGTGSKSFEIEANKSFPLNSWVQISYDGDPLDHYMVGQVTDYTGTTIQIESSVFTGSGTYNDWTLALSGPPGATGPTGPSGGGTGDLLAAQNLADLDDIPTARGNLGLGSAALLDVGTTANKVVQLDGSGALPAVSGANLTNLDASDLASGTVPTARLGSGTADATTVLYGNGTWGVPSPPSTFGGIGTYTLGVGPVTAAGATASGGQIAVAVSNVGGGAWGTGTTLAGTWRNMAGSTSTSTATLWMRLS